MLNGLDDASGRRVWFNYWDTRLSYQRSYLARLQYVHANAVHHGLAGDPVNYRWCSASWFEAKGDTAFVRTVRSFKTDSVKVRDDFDVKCIA
jgi:putative transposase